MNFKKSAIALLIISFLACSIAVNLSSSIKAVQAENYGYINKIGKLVIKPQFSEVHSFSQGLAAVKIGDKWGYINKSGKVVIKPQYSEVFSFYEGLAAVKIGDKWGYIDLTGKVVVKLQFNEAYSFSKGIAAVKTGDKWSYIDKTAKQVIRLQPRLELGGGYRSYDDSREAGFFSEGLTPVTINDNDRNIRSGYINKRGQLAIKTEFSEFYDFFEGLAVVETGDGICGVRAEYCAYGYIDKTGKMVIKPGFFKAKKFSQGLASVATEGYSDALGSYYFDKWGYINKRGQLVIKPIFSEANSFSEGLAAVEIGRIHNNSDENGMPAIVTIAGKWGYIDSTGKQVISPQFDLANSFSEGLAAVTVKDKCGYVNKIGKVVVKRRFSACADFSEGLAAVMTLAQ